MAFSPVRPSLALTAPPSRPWWWLTPSHRKRRWRRAQKYRYTHTHTYTFLHYTVCTSDAISEVGQLLPPFFLCFPFRSLTSPWSWQRQLEEPTTASQCPTSSVTYPCNQAVTTTPTHTPSPLRPSLLHLCQAIWLPLGATYPPKISIPGLLNFLANPMWLFEGHAHTLSDVFHQEIELNITSFSED